MRPGDALLLGDLAAMSDERRVVVEALLEAHGAQRGLDVDLWVLTTPQVDALLATVAAARTSSLGNGLGANP